MLRILPIKSIMRSIPDIAVYDAFNRLVLAVEDKSKLGTSSTWAAKMRRNLLAHDLLPSSPFFLLALPDRFYLWKDVGMTLDLVPPNYEIEPAEFLEPYYQASGVSPTNMSGESFSIIVASVIGEFMNENFLAKYPNQRWLVDSGLLQAFSGGSLAIVGFLALICILGSVDL